MKILVLRESYTDEKRVAITPNVAKKFLDKNHEVYVQAGAGEDSFFYNNQFENVGCKVFDQVSSLEKEFDLLLKIQPPFRDEDDTALEKLKKGGFFIGFLEPLSYPNMVNHICELGITSVALDYLPRIDEAQSMDVLTTQSQLAGYQAVIDASAAFGRTVPAVKTAVGTTHPARVLVLGAGVAGLKAIETAVQLGAEVSAIDVRQNARRDVEDRGAYFIDIPAPDGEDAELPNGYAKEMDETYQKIQAGEIEKAVKNTDIVICSALIPYVGAQTLITFEMLKTMKPGSVIVDLAVDYGGNVEASKPGLVREVFGVTIIAYKNYPSRVAAEASDLLAENLYNVVNRVFDLQTGNVKLDLSDELLQGTIITHNEEILHGRVKAETEASLREYEALLEI